MGAVPWYRKWPFEPWSFCDRVIGTALQSNQRWSWLLLAAPGCFWLLLATPGCAWRLLATPLAATIHASTDSWGRNFHMTQNISLITVFGHCAPGTRWILSRATLNHPYRRCALVDPLQSHVDARLSWPPPTMAKKVFKNNFQETSFAN